MRAVYAACGTTLPDHEKGRGIKMKTKLKKHIAFVLALLMVVAVMPMTASAAAVNVSDLASLLDALDQNKTPIVLTDNISSDVAVPLLYSGVLNLNGKTITGTVTNEGTLTIRDNATGGSIIAPADQDALINKGTLTIVSGNFEAGDANVAVYTLTSGGTDISTKLNGGTYKAGRTVLAGTADGTGTATVEISNTGTTFYGDIEASTKTSGGGVSTAVVGITIKNGIFNGNLIVSKNNDADLATITVNNGTFYTESGDTISGSTKVKVRFTDNSGNTSATQTLGYAYTSNNTYTLGDALPVDIREAYDVFDGWKFTNAAGNEVDGTYKTVTEKLLVALQDGYASQILTATPSFTRGINVIAPVNGTMKLSNETPAVNELVTITATPATGYILSELIVKNGSTVMTDVKSLGNGKYTFTYPANAAVTVEAKFARGVIVSNPVNANGKLVADKLTPAGGEEVTITVTPNTGYILNKLSVMNSETSKEIGTRDNGNKTYSFNFPDNASATVTATFVLDTGITITTTGSGTVTVDKTAPKAGETVTITATPATGYIVGQLTVKNGTTELTAAKQTGDAYTFTYPQSGAVAVDVLFTTGLVITKTGNGTVTVDKTAPKAGETVTVTATPDAGYVVGQLTVKNGTAELTVTKQTDGAYTFAYPSSGTVTVDVLFTTGIVIADTKNGSVKVDKTAPKAGEAVTVTIAADTGYALQVMTIKNGTATLPVKDNGNGTYTFTYPAGTGVTVTIDADFAPGVSVSKNDNGTVKVSKTLPGTGDTVTITITPGKGYKLDTLTVKNGTKALEVKGNTDGTYSFTYPAGGTVHVEAVFTDRLPFTDVPTDQWYYEAVAFTYDNTLFEGTTKTAFSPGRNMTRAMMVQVLFNMTDGAKKGDVKFSDVPSGQWYFDAISWAASKGVVGGVGNNRFAPMSDITREQMALMLYNYADVMDIKLPKTRSSGAFADAGSISGWAKEAVDAMYAAEVLNGKGENRFDPQGKATRAQVAEMFMNFMDAVQ